MQSLAHNLAGSGQDVTFGYARNQAQEIKTLSWSNDLYGWTATQGTRAFTANGLNQYTAVASVPYTYDGNGNLTGDGVWSYGYDADNRLRTATASNVTATLAWDAVGRLRQTTTGGTATQLMYAGNQLVAEYDGAGALLRRYVYGPGIDEPMIKYEGTGTANKSWYYADHLGSVVATADGAGDATGTLTYGPYGEPGSTLPARFGYTGQQYLAPLGLYHYKARFYSPAIGRFLQTDPIGYDGGTNFYCYVANNPINTLDSTGTQGWPGALIGAASGGYQGYLAAGWPGLAVGAVLGGITGVVLPPGASRVGNWVASYFRGNATANGLATGTTIVGGSGIVGGLGTTITNLSSGEQWDKGVGTSILVSAATPLASGEAAVVAFGGPTVSRVASTAFSLYSAGIGTAAVAVDPNSINGLQPAGLPLSRIDTGGTAAGGGVAPKP